MYINISWLTIRLFVPTYFFTLSIDFKGTFLFHSLQLFPETFPNPILLLATSAHSFINSFVETLETFRTKIWLSIKRERIIFKIPTFLINISCQLATFSIWKVCENIWGENPYYILHLAPFNSFQIIIQRAFYRRYLRGMRSPTFVQTL